MNNKQTRVSAIHDISCFGKCSLTVVLPILSAAGIETSVIPTAVLSTHTGGFKNFTFRDLTNDILPVANHWKANNIQVDCVYTGYLGSKEQISIVSETADLIKSQNGFLLVDPVMADNGVLYGGFVPDFPMEMKKLCQKADIITPNITEAVLMLNKEYIPGPYTNDYIENLLTELYKMAGCSVVLTGVYFDNDKIGAACYDGNKIFYSLEDKVNCLFHGTGDVFSSALLAGLLNNQDIKSAMETAVKYTRECIDYTFKNREYMRYGVAFEECIPYLLKLLNKI